MEVLLAKKQWNQIFDEFLYQKYLVSFNHALVALQAAMKVVSLYPKEPITTSTMFEA
jgi:hypothetical protein